MAEGSEEYEKKETGPWTVSGFVYQIRILSLFLLRAVFNKYEFQLATEMVRAEYFDDLVFKYKKDRTDKFSFIFLQAKHIIDTTDENKLLSYDNLLSVNWKKEFCLAKYFYSYRKIMQSDEFNKDGIIDFILYTNINFDEKLQKNVISYEDREPYDFLDLNCNKSQFHKLGLSSIKDDDLKILKEVSDLHVLAKHLVDHIKNNKPLALRGIIKTYHSALVNNVIDIQEREKIYIGKFKEAFLNIEDKNEQNSKDLESVIKLRDILVEKIGNNILKNAELKLPISFCEVFYSNPQIKDIKNFTNSMWLYLKTAIENEKTECDINKNRKYIKNNIDKLAGHVLVKKDDKVKFSEAFFKKNGELAGNLKVFKTIIESKFSKKIIEFRSLSDYEFEIWNFPTEEVTNPEIDVEKLAKAIFSGLEYASARGKIRINIDKRKIGFQNIDTLAVHVLEIYDQVKKKAFVKFRQDFLDGNSTLPVYLGQFREELKRKIENQKQFNSLSQLSFNISHFPEFKEDEPHITKLPDYEEIDNGEIKDFFSALTFAVNQPDAIEFEKIISDEIEKECQSIDSEFFANHVQKYMLDWYLEINGKFITDVGGKELLTETKNKFDSLISNFAQNELDSLFN